jgi:hypothetical protein
MANGIVVSGEIASIGNLRNSKTGMPKIQFFINVDGKNGDSMNLFVLAFGGVADQIAEEFKVGDFALISGHLAVQYAQDRQTQNGIMIIARTCEKLTT